MPSLKGQHLKPWGSWSTAAEDYTGCHFCWLRKEKWGCKLNRLAKIGQQNIGRASCLMSVDFRRDIQIVGSEFGLINMKAWIHGASWWCKPFMTTVDPPSGAYFLQDNLVVSSQYNSAHLGCDGLRDSANMSLWIKMFEECFQHSQVHMLQVCHKALWQFWRQNRVKPFSSKASL